VRHPEERRGHPIAAMPPPYSFSTVIGSAAARQMRNFFDLAEELDMQVTDVARQCNGHAPPSKALVRGLVRELNIDEGYLDKLAEVVRKDLVPES
jgi:hypothetical protein